MNQDKTTYKIRCASCNKLYTSFETATKCCLKSQPNFIPTVVGVPKQTNCLFCNRTIPEGFWAVAKGRKGFECLNHHRVEEERPDVLRRPRHATAAERLPVIKT